MHYVMWQVFVPHCVTKKISKGIHIYKESFLQCLPRMGVKGEEGDAGGVPFRTSPRNGSGKIMGRSFFSFR